MPSIIVHGQTLIYRTILPLLGTMLACAPVGGPGIGCLFPGHIWRYVSTAHMLHPSRFAIKLGCPLRLMRFTRRMLRPAEPAHFRMRMHHELAFLFRRLHVQAICRMFQVCALLGKIWQLDWSDSIALHLFFLPLILGDPHDLVAREKLLLNPGFFDG
jgi:hypothetical protein